MVLFWEKWQKIATANQWVQYNKKKHESKKIFVCSIKREMFQLKQEKR